MVPANAQSLLIVGFDVSQYLTILSGPALNATIAISKAEFPVPSFKLVDGEDPSSLEVRYHVQHLWKTQLRDRALERIGVLEKAIMGITQGELPD